MGDTHTEARGGQISRIVRFRRKKGFARRPEIRPKVRNFREFPRIHRSECPEWSKMTYGLQPRLGILNVGNKPSAHPFFREICPKSQKAAELPNERPGRANRAQCAIGNRSRSGARIRETVATSSTDAIDRISTQPCGSPSRADFPCAICAHDTAACAKQNNQLLPLFRPAIRHWMLIGRLAISKNPQ